MAVFHYKAVSARGEVREGTLSAGDRDQAIAAIQRMGLIPISATEAGSEAAAGRRGLGLWRARRLGQRDVVEFTRQLAVLIGAGLPLDRALGIMRRVASHPPFAELLDAVQAAVRGGDSLSVALSAQGGLFTPFYLNFVRAAELSGALAQGLADLARYLEKAKALRDKLLSAMIYPLILVAVTLGSLLIILIYVLPEFSQLFADIGAALPPATAFVVGAADWLRDYSSAILALILAGLLYIKRRAADHGWRLQWDRRWLALPLVGDLLAKVEVARFSRSLGTLLRGGVPMLTAATIARSSLENRHLSARLAQVSESLEEGAGLAEPLIAAGIFPEFAVQMIQVGEETGQLDDMLLRVAEVYDDEVATAMQRLLSVVEPVMIVGLGVLIGGIILSILSAILSINEIPL